MPIKKDGTPYYPGVKPTFPGPVVRSSIVLPQEQMEALKVLVARGGIKTLAEGISQALVPYLRKKTEKMKGEFYAGEDE